MGCTRKGELNVRVDHKEGSLTFIDDPFVLADEPSTYSPLRSSRESPVQPSTAELVRTRLTTIANSLRKPLQVIDEAPSIVFVLEVLDEEVDETVIEVVTS